MRNRVTLTIVMHYANRSRENVIMPARTGIKGISYRYRYIADQRRSTIRARGARAAEVMYITTGNQFDKKIAADFALLKMSLRLIESPLQRGS